MGGAAVRGFSIALIIGIFVGTYSSIYTASAAALSLNVSPDDMLPPKVDKEVGDQP
jgi:preprotein translocase subunit SecF